ncbi:MAG: GAL4 enhancer protein [Marteilia pararefringens]
MAAATSKDNSQSGGQLKYKKTAEKIALKVLKPGLDEKQPTRVIFKVADQYYKIDAPYLVSVKGSVIVTGKVNSINLQSYHQFNNLFKAMAKKTAKDQSEEGGDKSAGESPMDDVRKLLEDKTTKTVHETDEEIKRKASDTSDGIDLQGCSIENIEMVMHQGHVSKEDAIKALVDNDQDVVNALMQLSI